MLTFASVLFEMCLLPYCDFSYPRREGLSVSFLAKQYTFVFLIHYGFSDEITDYKSIFLRMSFQIFS